MKKAVVAYALLAVVLAAICFVCVELQHDFHATIYDHAYMTDVSIDIEGDDVVTAEITPVDNDNDAMLTIANKGHGAGTCTVTVTARLDKTAVGEDVSTISYIYSTEVLPSGFLLVGGELVGAIPALICTIIYLAALAIGLGARFVWRKRHGLLCTYPTVVSLAFCLFTGASALALSLELWAFANSTKDFGLGTFMSSIASLASIFALIAAPFVFLVSLFLALSNIALIRHEGLRPTNMLGIAVGVIVALGYAALLFVQSAFMKVTVATYALNVAVPYLINLLGIIFIATAICGVLASRTKPRFDKDFIIILGCGIRADGTPTPLLAARVNRALEFARAQVQADGKQPLFICSGGQGPDEVISEAECMANYLQEQGIEKKLILQEGKSTTTLENMRFSRKVIAETCGYGFKKPRVAYSTTNYHVFRAGTFALGAGLDAEGMGAKTKWYFWPNAFLREFASFLVCSKASLALAVGGIILFSLALASAYCLT